jgi:hypothetical protein
MLFISLNIDMEDVPVISFDKRSYDIPVNLEANKYITGVN